MSGKMSPRRQTASRGPESASPRCSKRFSRTVAPHQVLVQSAGFGQKEERSPPANDGVRRTGVALSHRNSGE